MTLAEYMAAAVLVEAAKRPNDVHQSYVERDAITENLRRLVYAPISDAVIAEILAEMIHDGSIEIIQDEMAGDFYRCNHQKLTDVMLQKLSDPNSLSSKYRVIGNQFLQNALTKFSTENSEVERPMLDQPEAQIPASDRIVRLDDNSEARDEVVGKLDELASLLHGHNDEDGKLNDRERLIAEILAGQELLKAPTVRVKAIWAVLGTALAWLSTEFAGGLVGELAGLLFEALKPLLGI